MPELEWTVEYETLPPEGDLPPAWEPQEPPPRRRIPGGAWLMLVLVVAALGGFAYLYNLGGAADPLPSPESAQQKLATAVLLELDALFNGDQEIYQRMQDKNTRRTDEQPPPDVWFGDEIERVDRQVELVALETIEPDTGRAKVAFKWNGLDYRMMWYYRRADDLPGSQELRWVHTDWVKTDLGVMSRVSSKHFIIRHYPADQSQASMLVDQLEHYLGNLCETLQCPQQLPKITITMEPSLAFYGVENKTDTPFDYRISSPQRIRWPQDTRPEPLVLGSLGRHLAYDLFVRPVFGNLDPENRLALPMATSWLAHRLLLLEVLPGTEWLDKATRRDGLFTSAGFIMALAANLPPQQAVTAAFQPDTAGYVTGHQDYFAWLAVVQDPLLQFHKRPGAYSQEAWQQSILFRYDQFVEPWNLDGKAYHRTAPEIVHILQQGQWVAATTSLDSFWANTYYFRQTENGWQLAWPDETYYDELLQVTQSEHITLYYQTTDADYVPGLLELLEETYQQTVFNFSLSDTQPLTVAMLLDAPAARSSTYQPAVEADFYISPLSLATPSTDALAEERLYVQATLQLIMSLLIEEPTRPFLEDDQDSATFIGGVLLWQMENISGHSELAYADMLPDQELENWRPPPTVDSDAWISFSEIWPLSDPPEGEKIATLIISLRLVFEYLDHQYGREAMPGFIDALFEAESLEEWIAAINGQSAPEFELAWRQWVIDRYRD